MDGNLPRADWGMHRPIRLSKDGDDRPRTFTRRFRKPGTYRLFFALHPVQMKERVVVKK